MAHSARSPGLIHSVVHTVRRWVAPEGRQAQRADAHARHADRFEPHPSRHPHAWWPGRPLNQAVPAHRTNTPEEFQRALASGRNFFEGDVRVSVDPPHHLEMRHDKDPGDTKNLSLREWLARGKAAGVGLKLDIKEADQLPELIREVQAAHLDDHLLMLNLGSVTMAREGAELRRLFPHATLALNPGHLEPFSANVQPMIDLARRLGGPVTFVLRNDLVDAATVKQLEAVGPVSIWNEPEIDGNSNLRRRAHELRALGATGVVDLRRPPSPSIFERVSGFVSDLLG